MNQNKAQLKTQTLSSLNNMQKDYIRIYIYIYIYIDIDMFILILIESA